MRDCMKIHGSHQTLKARTFSEKITRPSGPFETLFIALIFRSLESQCGSNSAAATKKKKTIEMIPFMVKNAALRRRRSVGEMMRCS